MPANGLIFFVVVAIWAAYFVQYWIRRRDHLATARSMDRFSESMRVLARRSPLPASSLETPPAPSYAVSPARSMRPQVLVKRADLATSASIMANQVGGAVNSSYAGPSVRPSHLDSGPEPTHGVSRRVRGLVLLAQLGVFLVITVMALVGAVAWWAPFVAILAVGCAVVWVGEGARAARSSRMSHGHKAVRQPASARAGGVDRAARRRAPQRGRRDGAAPAAPESAPAVAEVAPDSVETETEVVEPYGFEGPAAAPAPTPAAAGATASAALVDEDDIPLTWDPRPVPRPTYTMKARADRPLPPPADVTPTPIWVDEDDDVRPVESQRHTG